MVEVHLVRLEASAAVITWHTAKIAQELKRRSLPHANAFDLLLTVACVVADVEGALITQFEGHTPS